MFFRILKRDLKRKKTMNVILLLFVILSAMFASSSVNNIVSVMGGIDYFMDKSGIGDMDYCFLTAHKNNGDTLTAKLEAEPSVTSIRRENVIYISPTNIKKNGENAMDFSNASMIQRVGETSVRYFDENNNEITQIPENGIYISSAIPGNSDIKKGDILEIIIGSHSVSLEYLGRAKDALLGSNFMNNPRLMVNDKVYEDLLSDEKAAKQAGSVFYIKTTDRTAVAEATSTDTSILFSGEDSVIRTTYIMEILVAALLLIVSVLLIIIAFVVLRFTIGFTIAEEFREIGVMKAIGIRNRSIRALYLIKYFGMAVFGSVIGYFLGIPFGKLMLGSAEQSMVLGNNSSMLIGITAAIVVVIIIMLFSYSCTRKIKKLSPIDAVRNGQTGERFRRHSLISLGKSKLSTGGFLAVNDVISQPRQYGILTVIFTLCLMLVMILANTANTLSSEKLLFTLNVTKSDLYYTCTDMSMALMGDDSDYKEYISESEKKLADAGIPGKIKSETSFALPAEFGNVKQKINFLWCKDTDTTEYVYERGTAPQNIHEFATTPQMCDKFGFDIGDKVKITVNGKTDEYLLTAVYQSMYNLGESARLHQDMQMNISDGTTAFNFFQIDFDDHPDAKTAEARKDKIREVLNANKVLNTGEFVDDCTNSASSISAIKDLVLIISLLIITMISVLMERSFITREKSELALMKALGFNNRNIILHHTLRFAISGVLAGILAAALCMPCTKLAIDPIFGIMGATEGISYKIVPAEIFLLYPALVITVIILSAFFTSFLTAKVKASDTANIE